MSSKKDIQVLFSFYISILKIYKLVAKMKYGKNNNMLITAKLK